MKTPFILLQRQEVYRDTTVDYEALLIKRRATRWDPPGCRNGLLRAVSLPPDSSISIVTSDDEGFPFAHTRNIFHGNLLSEGEGTSRSVELGRCDIGCVGIGLPDAKSDWMSLSSEVRRIGGRAVRNIWP